jgi:hypothetical protein
MLMRKPWAMPTAIEFHAFGVMHELSGFAAAHSGKALPYRAAVRIQCGEAEPRRISLLAFDR